MKNSKLLLLLVTSSFLVGCSTQNTSNSNSSNSPGDSTTTSDSHSGGGGESTTSEDPHVVPASSIQDMTILHAFNWSINNINSQLNEIKNAGYGAIQLSPLQVQKDYSAGGNWSGQWWKLYQPLSFSVASQDGQNVMGKKSDLTTLCTNAEALGIKIVMDVVSNHLANSGGGENVYNLKSDVQSYESRIYNDSSVGGPLTHSSSVHHSIDDSKVEWVVRGNMGMPDLMTEKTHVQDRVKSLLQEYIDCGVDGFRFDAAKHIETPDDGTYASDFWPNVLNATTQYANNKGQPNPYYYGEILGGCGNGRSYSSYTKYMSVVDNDQGSTILNGIVSNNISKATTETYNSGVNADHLVLWAESHDTYSNDAHETTNISQENIDKAYVIQASRKDAACLYLARPANNTIFGNIGTYAWKNNVVKAINAFHNRYIGKSEHITNYDNKYFVNVRGSGDFAGATIVNVNGSNSATINLPGLKDGKYTDLVSNTLVNVSNGSAQVSFNNGCCILIPGDPTPQTTYNSNVVLKNYTPTKFYYAWLYEGTQADKWVKLETDHDALGFNLGSYNKYIIVEFNSDNPVWNTQNWKSADYAYGGSQDIYDCNTIPKASS